MRVDGVTPELRDRASARRRARFLEAASRLGHCVLSLVHAGIAKAEQANPRVSPRR